MKITEKVSFNIERKASYFYILSGQKLIENAQNGPFGRVLERVLPDRSAFRQQKMVGNAQIQKFKWDILRNFQSMCVRETESLCHPATVIFVAKINQMKNVRSTQLDPDTTAREKNTFRDPAFLSLFSAFEFFVLEFYAASL